MIAECKDTRNSNVAYEKEESRE